MRRSSTSTSVIPYARDARRRVSILSIASFSIGILALVAPDALAVLSANFGPVLLHDRWFRLHFLASDGPMVITFILASLGIATSLTSFALHRGEFIFPGLGLISSIAVLLGTIASYLNLV